VHSQPGNTYTLTTGVDDFVGGAGNDTFNGTYSDGGIGDGNTLNLGDTLNGGGGINTLNITPNLAVGAGAAATTLVDGVWADVSNIEALDVTTTAGALSITSGVDFEAAFAAAGVALTTASGAGAITLDLATFTGEATIVATNTGGGAQSITGGSGATTVTATAFSGAQTIIGADLVTVHATNDGAGAQTITSTSSGAVTITAIGFTGAQTITTGAGNDHITVTTSAGADNSITTGAGNDIITLSAAAGAGSHNSLTDGPGANVINLGVQTVGTVDTLFLAPGDSTSTAFDTVSHMTDTDLLSYLGATATLLASGPYTAIQTGHTGVTATAVNGELTFTGTTTLAVELSAAVTLATTGHVAGTVDAFVNAGNTYVVEYNATAPVVVELVGVDAPGLATAAATVHYT
jgi:hypothetical protein